MDEIKYRSFRQLTTIRYIQGVHKLGMTPPKTLAEVVSKIKITQSAKLELTINENS